MAQIRITPEELREGASFLLQKMEAVIDEVNEIKSKVDEVASEWEGAAQNSFVAAFESMLPTLQKDFPEIIEGIEYYDSLPYNKETNLQRKIKFQIN